MEYYSKWTLGKRWVLRKDIHTFQKYRAINIDSGLSLTLSKPLFYLLKIFANNSISFAELNEYLSKNNIHIELDQFYNIVNKYKKTCLLEKGLNITKLFFESNIDKAAIPITTTPENVEIHFTHKCNLACKHCFQLSSPTSNLFKEISKDEWVRIFTQLERYNTYNIVLSGGEPMFYSEFDSLINDIVEKRLRFNILTNGIKVNSNNISALCRSNVELTISVDGHNALTHDFLRGKGAFDKVSESLIKLCSGGAKVHLSYTIHRKNYMYIKDFLNFAIGHGIKSVGFLLIDPLGRAEQNSDLLFTSTEMNKITENIENLKLIYSSNINILYTDPIALNVGEAFSDIISCSAGTNRFAIDPSGIMYPCAMAFGEKEFQLADLKKEDIQQIWKDKDKWSLFRGTVKMDDIKGCRECALKNQCTLKNCRLKSYRKNKDFYARPIGCKLERFCNI